MNEAQPRNRILSVGSLPLLLSLRHAVLESTGYEVFSTDIPQKAAERIRAGDCGVLVICYSTGDSWRRSLIRDYRKHCPNGRIVEITNHQVGDDTDDVDALVYGLEGPEILIDAIRGNGKAA
jgi:hypothetical protein